MPKPTDWTEQTKAIDTYKRLRATVGQERGVVAFYLTTHNDPRAIMVEVADEATYNRLREKYPSDMEGLKLKLNLRPDLAASDTEVEVVATADLAQAYTERAWAWVRNFARRLRTWPRRTLDRMMSRLGGAWDAGPEPSPSP